MRPTIRPLVLAAALAAAGCAHAPAEQASASPVPEKVVVTGSRIPQRVDLSTGRPATTSPVTVFTQGDLQRAGAPPIPTGDALRRLDPSIR